MADSATTRAKLADRAQNPSSAAASGRTLLQFNINFVGLQAKPEDVFDALITKFGAGKVTSPGGGSGGARGVFNLEIAP